MLKALAVVAFITGGYGLRALLSPIVEAGGLTITVAIIGSCLVIAHVIEPTR